MKILFHVNQYDLRGTGNQCFNYAHYNEKLYNNESFVIAKDPSVWNYSHPLAIEKFKKRFNGKMFFYKSFSEVEKVLDDNDIDYLYALKAGMKDGIISKNHKSLIHVVFQNYDPHGDKYVYISKWLADKYKSKYVPHMIDLPNISDNLRNDLNIPNNAIVFGRHGGYETFNVDFSKEVVVEIAEKRKDIYFLFLNTERFSSKSIANILYLEPTVNEIYITKFINTCDCMLHGRTQGESFGLSVFEFSSKNKPVITWTKGRDKAHIDMLGNKGIYYTNKKELLEILNSFKIDNSKDWNAAKDFTPEKVMDKFNNVFLK